MKQKLNGIIPVDTQHKNIAIRLSGGPDSSIIYYALCDFYKDNDNVNLYPYTLSTPLRPHSGPKSTQVIELVGKLTGKYPVKHYELFNENHCIENTVDNNSYEYTKGQEDLEAQIRNNHSIDASYSGLSINCPIDEMITMIDSPSFEFDKEECKKWLLVRDDSRSVPTEEIISNAYNVTIYLPFAHSDKRTVYNMYRYYNLLDVLYPITWSCENHMQIHSSNPVHCGVCYFCLERLYAFGKL